MTRYTDTKLRLMADHKVEEAIRQRDYWKKRAQEDQSVAYSSGMWTGVIATSGCVTVLGIIALAIFG